MPLHEAIIASVSPPSGNAALGSGSLVVLDSATGSALASFKPSSAPPRGVGIVNSHAGDGGLMFATQENKAILHVWSYQKDQVQAKMVLPEKVGCIAVDRRATWLAAGTSSGRIYIWEVASGVLFNAWDAHYRKVSVLRFTDDGGALISGSDDAGVNVWSIVSLVDNDHQNEVPSPWYSLSDHTLPITDIAAGVGAFPRVRVFTSSLDHTVKVWDLATKSLLSTFHLPSPLQHLILDPTERAFFAASNLPTGEVYQFNLFQPRKNPLGHEDQDVEIEAVGGHGRGDVIRVEVDSDAARRKRVFEPNAPVTSLALSLTSSNLLIGTSTGKIMVFDVASHQLLRTFSPSSSASAAAAGGASPFSVTHIHTCLRPADLVGHVALSITAGKERDWMPVTRHVAPFQRTRDLKAREAREVWMRLPDTSPTSEHIEYEEDELLADLAFFRSPASSSAAGNDVQGGEGVTSERVRQLEEEVERLKGRLSKARGVNERMWEAVVKKVVKDGETETPQAHSEVEERARKKGRK